MTLMDLALQFNDYKWAENIAKISIEPITEKKEFKKESSNYSSSNYIKEELKKNGQLDDYTRLLVVTKGLDIESKIQVIKNLGVEEKYVEDVLIIMNDLEK